MKRMAKGTFEVDLRPLPFEGAEPEWKLGRMSIGKQFSGDLNADAQRDDGYRRICGLCGD